MHFKHNWMGALLMREIFQEEIKYDESIKQSLTNKRQYEVMKRFIDFSGALIGIIVLSPLLFIVSVLIMIDDPKGNVLFKQIRVGKNGELFKMYKFRSMVHNAEEKLGELLKYNEVSGAMFKMKDDPRVTTIGKFIRKTSIDELPQLFNVLMGKMSLVGPRPPLESEVKQYTHYETQRLSVTPGCTGLWQCSARNSVGFKEMVELDLKYIKERGILFDFKILFKTVLVFILPNNAY